MRMAESVIDEKRIRILGLLPFLKVIHDLFPMPVTSLVICTPTPGTIVSNGEKFIGSLETVTILTGTHGIVSRSIENRR